MIIEHLATCPHCNQEMFVVCGEAEPGEELLRELAADVCKCPGAVQERGMRSTENRIQAIMGDGATKRGFDYAFPEETLESLRGICGGILRQEYDKVTLTEKGGDVVRLIRDGNAVKVRRSTKRQMEL